MAVTPTCSEARTSQLTFFSLFLACLSSLQRICALLPQFFITVMALVQSGSGPGASLAN